MWEKGQSQRGLRCGRNVGERCKDAPVVVGTSTGLTFSNSLSHIDTTT